MGITVAVIAHGSAADNQGGSSNLQRYKSHHPPIFTGGGDPMVADHWFRHIEKVLEAIDITSDTTKIRLAEDPGRDPNEARPCRDANCGSRPRNAPDCSQSCRDTKGVLQPETA